MQPSSSFKVLLVEDEGLIAHDVARRLESLGHQVLATVSTADEAVEQAAQADLVLMDIHIDGGRDGIDAAIEIRARHRVPVVFVTAHADRATLERAKLAGPFGFVVKPLGAGALHAAIELATYKHRMERQLEEREAWYRATLDSAPDAIISVDPVGRVRTLNRAAEALTGWNRDRAEGRRLTSIARVVDERTGLDAGDPVAIALVRDAAVALPPDARLVFRGTGEEADAPVSDAAVEGAAAPVKDSAETLGAVLTLRDVGFRRWEERQLRQSQRLEAAGRLAASVAAEYGHLLAAIRNQASVLLEQFGEYSPARRAAEEIHQAASAADQLTRRLAAFGTRRTGEPQVISLNRILRNMAKLIDSVARGRAQVTLRLEPGAGQVQVDPALLEQAIMNLILHACASVAPGGVGRAEDFPGGVFRLQQLSITTRRTQLAHRARAVAFVSLSLEYSAVEPDLERMFDPVPSADAGLALSVAHSIVQEHGGFLTARPTRASGEGSAGDTCGGTYVEMLLPLASEDLPLAAASDEPCAALAVLLVDPREEVRVELHNFFEAAGFNLLEAVNCEEATTLAELHDGPLDLVIADSNVADSLLEAVRAAHPAIEALRIVDAPERSRLEIRRPFSGQALAERVRLILSSRPPELSVAAISS